LGYRNPGQHCPEKRQPANRCQLLDQFLGEAGAQL